MADRPWYKRLWYSGLRRVVQMVSVLAYGIRCWGQHNIPRSGGVLVVSNHQSHFDPPLVGMAVMRRMNYVARDTLFGFAPFRWLINSLDAIPIDREGIGLGGIKESLRRLKRGEMVLVFPEGTRTRDGELGTFRPGFTVLAARSGASILPVAIEGAHAVWPKGRKFPTLGPIHVCYGKPLGPEQIVGRPERELIAEIPGRIRECQAKLRRHPLFAGQNNRHETRRRLAARPGGHGEMESAAANVRDDD